MASTSVRIARPGNGIHFPKDGETVRVHYVGKLQDGSVFDSSRDRSRSFEFKVGAGQVIDGWEEHIKTMSKGQISILTIPPEKAYGPHGYPPIIPPNATLIFEIELLSFV